MKITPYSNLNSSPVKRAPKVAPDSVKISGGTARAKQSDTPDVSPEAQMLAKNREALRDLLPPREEVLRKYAATLHEPLVLQDRTIDRLLQNLQSA
jgi:hypothetical protein